MFAALGLDALVILVFAGIGRASHHESNPAVDALQTAWPFLAGAAVGWLLVRSVSGRLPLQVRTGWPVWLCAVAVGMILRRLTGEGTAFPFIVVATIFLGVFLLGWRLAAGIWQLNQN
ncbi:MAG TPA: DUF3054 domain-containing protein [Flexivirga sp.]|uniref:DUF3054 domain-containing protein n=1 Tax=Flexivirga sp. TaxID=1962927 RepID=UPI002BC5E235|nr:DUF3054 domain-containing protein [Flexivirga sp.]HWC22408.1 DUF3054 domain-containing protein [Flexivirga sp.]